MNLGLSAINIQETIKKIRNTDKVRSLGKVEINTLEAMLKI